MKKIKCWEWEKYTIEARHHSYLKRQTLHRTAFQKVSIIQYGDESQIAGGNVPIANIRTFQTLQNKCWEEEEKMQSKLEP